MKNDSSLDPKSARAPRRRSTGVRTKKKAAPTATKLDRGLDQGVEFLSNHGFAGAQLKHLFSLETRKAKFLYIASVAGFTVAVTFFSRSVVGRTLKRVPFLRWA